MTSRSSELSSVIVADAIEALVLMYSVANGRFGSVPGRLSGSYINADADQLDRHLQHMALVDAEGRPQSVAVEQLVDGSQASARAMILHEWDQQTLWVDIDSTLRGHKCDAQQYRTLRQPGRLSQLLAAMLEVDHHLLDCLGSLEFTTSGTIYDVAGGHGLLAKAIAQRSTGSFTDVVVVDFPEAESTFRQHWNNPDGVVGSFVGCDLLDLNFLDHNLGRGLIMFSRCLHNLSCSARDAVLRYAVKCAEPGSQLLVINPSWDFGEASVRNPSVAEFSLYMSVNCHGGGVPTRARMHRELAQFGSVTARALTPELDAYVVTPSTQSLADSLSFEHKIPVPRRNVSQGRDLEMEADRFIPASAVLCAIANGFGRLLSSPASPLVLEQQVGIPTESLEALLAVLCTAKVAQVVEGGSVVCTIEGAALLNDPPESWIELQGAWRDVIDSDPAVSRAGLVQLLKLAEDHR